METVKSCRTCKHQVISETIEGVPARCWDCTSGGGYMLWQGKGFTNPEWDGVVSSKQYHLLCTVCGERLGEHVGSKCNRVPLKEPEVSPEEMALAFPEEVTAMQKQVGGTHYKDMKIQPITFAVANKLNPCQTIALRYLTRRKGFAEDIIQDRRKCIHMIEMEIEMLQRGEL